MHATIVIVSTLGDVMIGVCLIVAMTIDALVSGLDALVNGVAKEAA